LCRKQAGVTDTAFVRITQLFSGWLVGFGGWFWWMVLVVGFGWWWIVLDGFGSFRVLEVAIYFGTDGSYF
jgi:hypothetical protein